MSSVSKKRKHSGGSAPKPMKYYAVRKGHMPGVYTEWKDCLDQTTKFKGAMFKAYTSEADALAFVAGQNPLPASSPATTASRGKSEEPKFYGVAVGRVPGVYYTWPDAQDQISDVKGPKYKKFATKEEAEDFVRKFSKDGASSQRKIKKAKAPTVKKGELSEPASDEADNSVDDDVEEQPISKKVKTSRSTAKLSAPSRGKGDFVRVWTDGSSRGNGKVGASAGVGVFFGDDDPRNIGEPLEGPAQTNQRAELTAVLRALETIPQERNLEITTDSSYSINCCTKWIGSWLKNDWKTSTGSPVLNKDLVVDIKALIDSRTAKGAKTELTWVKGHGIDYGNQQADVLAVKGAMMPRI